MVSYTTMPMPMPIMTSTPNFSSHPMEPSYSSSSQGSMDSYSSSYSFTDMYPSPGGIDIPGNQPLSDIDQYAYLSTSPLPMDYPPNAYPFFDYPNPSFSYSTPPSSYDSNTFCDQSLLYIPDEINIPQCPSISPPYQGQEQSRPTKPFACDDCGRSFTRSADLKRHQSSVHNPIFQDCPVADCSRKSDNGFPRRDHLIEHLRSYHHVDVPKRRGLKRGKSA